MAGAGAAPSWAGAAEATSAQEAYNIFEEVLGSDPFKDFDALFQDPTGDAVDHFFASHFGTDKGKNPGAARQQQAPQTAQQRRGGQAHAAESAGAAGTTALVAEAEPPVLPFAGVRVRCLASNGVAYRASPALHDRLLEPRGPCCGDVLVVAEHLPCPNGDGWVRVAKGWLPLSAAAGGERLMQVLPPGTSVPARCLSESGVAYRASMDLDNRLLGGARRGPGLGQVVEVEERFGGWARTAYGWLPLEVAGKAVFELADPSQVPVDCWHPLRALKLSAGDTANRLWTSGLGLASSCLPTMPFGVVPMGALAIVGSSCALSLKLTAMAVRAWTRMSFGLLPRLLGLA